MYIRADKAKPKIQNKMIQSCRCNPATAIQSAILSPGLINYTDQG